MIHRLQFTPRIVTLKLEPAGLFDSIITAVTEESWPSSSVHGRYLIVIAGATPDR
jgi:hypothetical protein